MQLSSGLLVSCSSCIMHHVCQSGNKSYAHCEEMQNQQLQCSHAVVHLIGLIEHNQKELQKYMPCEKNRSQNLSSEKVLAGMLMAQPIHTKITISLYSISHSLNFPLSQTGSGFFAASNHRNPIGQHGFPSKKGNFPSFWKLTREHWMVISHLWP